MNYKSNRSNNCTSKVRYFLCLSPVLARHIGEQKVRIHTFITLSLDQGKRSASLLTLANHLKYPVDTREGGPRAGVDKIANKEILFLPGIKFWSSYHTR
jgi:hypothetical protein